MDEELPCKVEHRQFAFVSHRSKLPNAKEEWPQPKADRNSLTLGDQQEPTRSTYTNEGALFAFNGDRSPVHGVTLNHRFASSSSVATQSAI